MKGRDGMKERKDFLSFRLRQRSSLSPVVFVTQPNVMWERLRTTEQAFTRAITITLAYAALHRKR